MKKYMIEGMPEDEQDTVMLFEIEQNLENIDLQIGQSQEDINSMGEKQDYIHVKISEVSKEIIQNNTEFSGSLGK